MWCVSWLGQYGHKHEVFVATEARAHSLVAKCGLNSIGDLRVRPCVIVDGPRHLRAA